MGEHPSIELQLLQQSNTEASTLKIEYLQQVGMSNYSEVQSAYFVALTVPDYSLVA